MRKSILLLLCAAMSVSLWAYEFVAQCSSGQKLTYHIIDAVAKTCEVEGTYGNQTGELTIDAAVVNPNDEQTYTVLGIGHHAFYYAGELTKVTFPTASTFTYIGKDGVWSYCFDHSGISGKLVLPDNITEIGNNVFSYTDITEIEWSKNITKVGPSTFYGCKELTHVELPENVTYVGSTAFGVCYNLVSLKMGSKVKTVIWDAFEFNGRMDSLVIEATTPPDLDATMREEMTKSTVLYVPSASVSAYKLDPKWGAFKYIYPIGTDAQFHALTLKHNTYPCINHDCGVEIAGMYIENAHRRNFAQGESVHIQLYPARFWAAETVTLNGVDITASFVKNEADITINTDVTLEIVWGQPKKPYDFAEAVQTGQVLYFTITDAVNKKVKIVNQSGSRSVGGHTGWGYIQQEEDGSWGRSFECPSGDLIIPATIEHDKVTYTIEEIDTLAFSGARMTSIALPEGLKAIRAAAFYDCGYLTGSLFIPMSCSVAEKWAFRDCDFSEVSTGGVVELPEYLTLGSKIAVIKSTSATRYIDWSFQSGNGALRTVDIGENVERVSKGAFDDCSNITAVYCYAMTPPVMKDNAEQVYEDTEWYGFNPSGATLYVPKGTKSDYEVANCWKDFGTIKEMKDSYTISVATGGTGLGNVSGAGRYESGTDTILTAIPTLHYQFTKWSDGNTDNPRHITVTKDETYTAEFAPIATKVGDLLDLIEDGHKVAYEVISVSPREVKLISNGHVYDEFEGEWTIPGTVTDYWGDAFQLTRLTSNCFYGNSKTEILHIPEGVRVLENAALYNAYNLKELYFPATIDTVDQSSITYCHSLEDVHFAGTDNLRYIDFSTFTYGYTHAPISSNTPENTFCIKDGVALFYMGNAPEILDVPEGVKVIGEYVLPYGDDVKAVRLPSTLKTLCGRAFVALRAQCKTIYSKAVNPPSAGQFALSAYENGMKVVVSCDADLAAYKAHDYWKTLQSVVAGAQFVLNVECNNNNYGTCTVTEPVCGTAHIVAHPAQYYHVDSWSTGAKTDAIDVVLTKDTLITVNFVLDSYTVRFLDWDGRLIKTVSVQHGEMVGSEMPDYPATKTGYTCSVWTRSDGLNEDGRVYSDVDFTATYSPNSHTIVFKNWNGAELLSYDRYYDETVYYNVSAPTRAEDDTYTYTFTGWNPECTPGVTLVKGDQEYVAQFTATYREYSVQFNNYDGSQLDLQTLHYGDVITYAGATPTKPETAQYMYVFSGWDQSFDDGVTTCSGNVTYTAQFEAKTRKYMISFVDEDGLTPLWSSEFEYGATPVYGGNTPTKAADAQYTYSFSGWSPDIASVTGEKTYVAQYSSTTNKYDVTFQVEGNPALKYTVNDVLYGTLVNDLAEQVKAALGDSFEDGEYIYTYAGLKDVTATDIVSGDATYYVLYDAEPKTPSGIENMTGTAPATKIYRNGQLYILRDGKTYNAAGAEVE